MPVTNPDKSLTVSAVEKELTDLEAIYRHRKRKLRALLAVLKDEAEGGQRSLFGPNETETA